MLRYLAASLDQNCTSVSKPCVLLPIRDAAAVTSIKEGRKQERAELVRLNPPTGLYKCLLCGMAFTSPRRRSLMLPEDADGIPGISRMEAWKQGPCIRYKARLPLQLIFQDFTRPDFHMVFGWSASSGGCRLPARFPPPLITCQQRGRSQHQARSTNFIRSSPELDRRR